MIEFGFHPFMKQPERVEQHVTYVESEWGGTPEVIFDPKGRENQRIVLRRRAYFAPDSPQPLDTA